FSVKVNSIRPPNIYPARRVQTPLPATCSVSCLQQLNFLPPVSDGSFAVPHSGSCRIPRLSQFARCKLHHVECVPDMFHQRGAPCRPLVPPSKADLLGCAGRRSVVIRLRPMSNTR